MNVEIGDILAGLDIGTSKTCAVIGEVTAEGLNIIGAGSAPSKGIQKGTVINIDAATQAIRRAVDTAEVLADCKISSVIADINGSHVRSLNSNGVAPVKSPEISDSDIDRVLESAKAVAIPQDREFLHVIAQEYVLDGQEGIRNPKGMSGVRLEASVHIITCSQAAEQNIVKCVNRGNIEVADLVLSVLACGEAVLTDDEKELGCILIDIGCGTTDVAVWAHGSLVHTCVLEFSGSHLTKDIAKGLQIPLIEAEKLKLFHGCAMEDMVGADEIILVPTPDGREPRKLPKKVLAEIIQPRLEEIFGMVRDEISRSGFSPAVTAGVVLTGGTSIMDAVPELAERVFGMTVRRGVPRGVGGLTDFIQNPQYSTAIGLLMYASSHHDISSFSPQEAKRKSLFGRFVQWLRQIV